MIIITPPQKIVLKQSNIHGLGVFATNLIKEGEVIEKCPLIPLPRPENSLSPLNGVLKDYRYSHPTVYSRGQVIAAGYGSYYNHSSTPNAMWRDDETKNYFEFYALRDIEPEEEIFICYGGENYFKNRPHIEVKEPE